MEGNNLYDKKIEYSLRDSANLEEKSYAHLQAVLNQLNTDDPLQLAGQQYRKKTDEIIKLRNQNTLLLDKIRRLEESKRSGFGNDAPSPRQFLNYDADEDRKRFREVQAKLKETQIAEKQFQEKFDKFLINMHRALSKAKNEEALRKLIKMESQAKDNLQPGDGLISIPRRFYQKLLDVYSINMADIALNEMVKANNEINNHNSQIPEKRQMLGAARATFQGDFLEIAKGLKVEDCSLHLFLSRLAARAGFQSEWDRYHHVNTQESIKLQAKIFQITKRFMKKELPLPALSNDELRHGVDQSEHRDEQHAPQQKPEQQQSPHSAQDPAELVKKGTQIFSNNVVNQPAVQQVRGSAEAAASQPEMQVQAINKRNRANEEFFTKINLLLRVKELEFSSHEQEYWREIEAKARSDSFMKIQEFIKLHQTGFTAEKLRNNVFNMTELICRILKKTFLSLDVLLQSTSFLETKGLSEVNGPTRRQLETVLREAFINGKFGFVGIWVDEYVRQVASRLKRKVVPFHLSNFGLSK